MARSAVGHLSSLRQLMKTVREFPGTDRRKTAHVGVVATPASQKLLWNWLVLLAAAVWSSQRSTTRHRRGLEKVKSPPHQLPQRVHRCLQAAQHGKCTKHDEFARMGDCCPEGGDVAFAQINIAQAQLT